MGRSGGWFSLAVCCAVVVAAAPAHAVVVPQALSVGGQLLDADGTPISQTSVNFRIELRDPGDTCVLYREDHLGENLADGHGRFNLTLGSGSGRVNNVGAVGVLDAKVFVNSGAVAVAGCGASPLTLAAGDTRLIHVSYDLGSGYVLLTPSVPVVASAYAMVAESLNGLTAQDFIQANGSSSLSQVNAEYAFSTANWPRLKALLDGTSSQYLPTTPLAAVDLNGQRLTDLQDPVDPTDATNKRYVDGTLGGQALDTSTVGPMLGNGSTLVWDATTNKWVAGTASAAPTGAAGGHLAGTYPNPSIADNVVTLPKLNTTGAGVNRLLITDATTGNTVGAGTCPTVNQVYAWTATGWACTNAAALSAVTSVEGMTGDVQLTAYDIDGIRSAALRDVGTSADRVVALDTSARLPAVDASLLTHVNAVQLRGRAIAATAPTANQVLGWNDLSSQWEPRAAAAGGGSVNIATGTGLTGGPITTTGTIHVDVGTAANKIVQENANAQIAQANGSAALPSYAFGPSPNTGVYSPGLGQLALTANGTAALHVAADGAVGLGTNAPLQRLDVRGGYVNVDYGRGIRVGSDLAPAAEGGNDTWFGGTSRLIETDWVAGYDTTSIYVPGSQRSAALLTLVSTGRVGIGTTSPAAALDVSGNGTAASAIIVPRDTSLNRPAGVDGMIRYNTDLAKFEGFAGGAWSTLATGSGAAGVTNVTSGVGLIAGSITTTGTINVDVGTAANKIVQENANAQIAQASGAASTPAFSFAGDLDSGLFSPGADQLALATSGTAALYVNAAGAIGIGTNAPSERLTVNGSIALTSGNGMYFGSSGTVGFSVADGVTLRNASTETVRLKTYGAAPVVLTTNSLDRVTVTSAGNVGVGTATPAAALDVAVTGSSSALIVPRDSDANRPTGVNGMIRYNTTGNVFEVFQNGAWVNMLGGGGASGAAGGVQIAAGGGAFASDATNFIWDNTNKRLGIGTATPRAALEVVGQAVARDYAVPTGATVDFSRGNTQVLANVGAATIALQNMVGGASYTLVITDATSRTYAFSGCANAYWSPASAATSGRSIYSILAVTNGAGVDCYVSWGTSYQ